MDCLNRQLALRLANMKDRHRRSVTGMKNEEKAGMPEKLIEALHLVPLETEGGLVAQTYVSTFRIGEACAGTTIYYLLRGNSFSHLHRLTGDEIYHFYLGDPVELTELLPDGTRKKTILGQDILHGQEVQHLVPAGNWQGSCLCGMRGAAAAPGGETPTEENRPEKWALLGTTMWPGYTDACYTHGNREELLRAYPDAAEVIRRLTGGVSY